MQVQKLNVKETDQGRFYFVDYGSEIHGRSSFRLWVHPSLIDQDEKGNPFIILPKAGVSLTQGKSNRTLILRPGGYNLFDVYVPCGYRGKASFVVTTPSQGIYKYYVFRSPRGRCGVSEGALVASDQEAITYSWHRSGRLYGSPVSGTTTLKLDGTEEVLEETDICEIEDLAEV